MNTPDAPIDAEQFVITRRRKLYKFALFANHPHCYEHEQWDASFAPTIVELGAGTALFSTELARRHPDERVVAIDVKADRLIVGAKQSDELTNVRYLRTRGDLLPEVIAPQSVRELWITFPDPFPRSRSAGRRLTHPTYLAKYRELLTPDGSLYLKHDSREFFHWTLEQLVAEGWTICELSFDLHDSQLADDYKIMTSYERRWLGEGLVTNFVRATPPRD